MIMLRLLGSLGEDYLVERIEVRGRERKWQLGALEHSKRIGNWRVPCAAQERIYSEREGEQNHWGRRWMMWDWVKTEKYRNDKSMATDIQYMNKNDDTYKPITQSA